VNETDYQYDALNNLTCAVQKGTDTTQFTTCAAAPATWRPRSFTYNSLSQLLTATNPESGTITYAYDNDGNVQTKLDARSIPITYAYDTLNRLTGKTYSNGDPATSYFYDQASYNGLTIANGIGRRTGMTDAAGSEAWSYDATGRALTDQRTTNGIAKSALYTYNLDGSIATIVYPSGRTITYAAGSAGRPLSAVDTPYSINYAIAAHYAPEGALTSLTNGANLSSTYLYNSRLQPCWTYATTGTALPWNSSSVNCTSPDPGPGNVLDLQYNFSLGVADNGNAMGITNKRDTTRSQSFTYDPLNRIATAKTTSTTGTTCWDEAFGYDPWGNLLSLGRISGYTCSNEELLNVTATTKNQISGDTYDAAGNLTNIPNPGGLTAQYNAENQLSTANGTGYTYDGDGKRVQKSSGTLYWYGMGSDALNETDLSGNLANEYIFLGGERVARHDSSGNVFYYFMDHLGTSREILQAGQTSPCYEADFYPFGGERVGTNTCPQNYKFTGKERDSESNLDNFGARYFGSSMGRFMSPDPLAGHREDPQTLNRYVYVRSNPLSLTDRTGLDFYLTCRQTKDNTKTCQKGVQGTTTTDANGKSTFTATVVTSASLRDPNSGNTATVNENGVQITTANGTAQGIFINNTPAADIQGSGALADFSFHIWYSNVPKGTLSGGIFRFNGTGDEAMDLLQKRGAFQSLFDRPNGTIFGFHPGTEQFRFGSGPSAHLSVPVDGRFGLDINPRVIVPVVGDFHVDAHVGSGHAKDVVCGIISACE
jgi:RHS repeat-associated protein